MSYRGLFVAALLAVLGASAEASSVAGVYEWPDGRRYRGEQRAGLPNGRGVMTWPGGWSYEGGFRDGKPHGAGVFTTCAGGRFSGERIGHLLALGGAIAWPVGKGGLSSCEREQAAVRDGE